MVCEVLEEAGNTAETGGGGDPGTEEPVGVGVSEEIGPVIVETAGGDGVLGGCVVVEVVLRVMTVTGPDLTS